MAVYVDAVRRHGSGLWCHMMTDVYGWADATSRLTAALAGLDPLKVWRTYELFELDVQFLVDMIALAEDEMKPILEERERSRGK